MTDRIDPQPPSGFRDSLPGSAHARQQMMRRIAGVFERFGFSPIDTPSLERLEVLTGGDPEFKKHIYQARITDDDEPLGLRFDLTVPLARYVSAHANDLVFPLAAYHIGNVWRGEHTQAGRFRQFVQCDADLVGATSPVADAQIIALAQATFTELGLGEKISFRISNRRILNGLAGFLQFDESKTPAVMRAIDKMDRHGWAVVAKELEELGLDSRQVDGIQEFLDLKSDSPEGLLDAAHNMLQFAENPNTGIENLRHIIKHMDALGIPRSAWQIDLAIARGLGYYTGTVFETQLAGSEQYGSVCSGGRYDNLVERFAPMHLPGVGMSIGFDRLFAALDELGLILPAPASAKIAVLDFDEASRPTVLKLASDLRSADVAVALYSGNDDSLKGQLGWALKAGIPFVAIMGATECEKGVVQLKDLTNHTQEEIPLPELASVLAR